MGTVREKPEENHGAAVRRRVRGARLVVFDIRRIGNDRSAGAWDLVEQAPLVIRTAQVDPVGIPVRPQFLPPQLAPIGPGVEATAQAAASAGELPGQIVGDLVRVHDQRRQPLAGRSLTQVGVAEIRELQVDDVEPLGAQDAIQGLLQRWHCDPQPLEAPDRGQGSELQQPLGETFPTVGVGNQHHLAAVSLHRPAALIDIELIVDEHHRGQVVTSRQLRHQPMHPRLSAKARRAGRHLGNVEDTEALWAHRSGSGPPGTEP